MSADWRTRCSGKLVDLKTAIGHIRRGDHIFVGGGAGTPTELLHGLVKYREHLAGHEVVHILALGPAPHVTPELKGIFRHNALFIGGNTRKAVQEGYADYTPIFLSEIPRMIRSGRIPVDVALVTLSPPDRHGFCSLGVDVAVNRAGIGACKVLIAEINPRMPHTHGNSFVHVDRIDAMVEVDRPLPELIFPKSDDVADRIGRYVADLVEDGSTLQMGIGSIPDAVVAHLGDKRDLGIHTEMFSDGVIPLIEKGVINCRCKTLRQGKAVVSFVMGSRRLYEFVADNPMIEFEPCDYTNDPFVIAQNEKMVAINTALEVDLTGQVCADSIGSRFYSGIGGQVDFIRGAARSRGGKPIIALPSLAMKGAASRIVPHLSEGAGVVTTRGDVHYVVTEYGVAQLHGKKVRERALALINIAHPSFRPWLLAESKRHNFIYRDQIDVPVHISQYPERFEKHARLEDGTYLLLRPVKPTDEGRLNDLFYELSEETIRHRFLRDQKTLSEMELQELCNLDYEKDMAIVACLPAKEAEEEIVVGVARYYLDPSTGFADATLVVADQMHNRGIGSLLMKHLVEVARRQGVHGLTGELYADNERMIKVFQRCELPVETTLVDGVYKIRIPFDQLRARVRVGETATANLPAPAIPSPKPKPPAAKKAKQSE